MAETDRDELDALAGEYVLGTLPVEERAATEARLRSDADFRGLVADWAERLQPLADTAPAAMPHADTFHRIAARIGAPAETPGANVVVLQRTIRRWRSAAAIVGAAAAVLAGVVVFDRLQPAPQSEFVAVLTADGAKPAFIATVDVAAGTISVRPVSTAAPQGKSYQLWAIEPNQAPRSLGLLEEAGLSGRLPVQPVNLTLAVSLEPEGGSPTGAPTGPVVFTGSLLPAK